MTTEFIAILLAGAAFGGFINGLAGFGTSLFALGWWLQIMPPKQAVALVLIMSIFSGLQGAWLVRRAIVWRRLAVFLMPALLGIPIGLRLLSLIDPATLTMIIAVFLLLYGGFFLARRDLPSLSRPTPGLDGGIGFLGGILGAMAGLSGALPTMWISLRDWTKEQSRAVLQPYNLLILGVSAAVLAVQGTYDRTVMTAVAIAFPATMAAAQIGLWTFRRLTDLQFRRLLIVMTFVSGAVLMLRTLL